VPLVKFKAVAPVALPTVTVLVLAAPREMEPAVPLAVVPTSKTKLPEVPAPVALPERILIVPVVPVPEVPLKILILPEALPVVAVPVTSEMAPEAAAEAPVERVKIPLVPDVVVTRSTGTGGITGKNTNCSGGASTGGAT